MGLRHPVHNSETSFHAMTCMYVYTHTYIYIRIHILVLMCTYTHIHVIYTQIFKHLCTHKHTHAANTSSISRRDCSLLLNIFCISAIWFWLVRWMLSTSRTISDPFLQHVLHCVAVFVCCSFWLVRCLFSTSHHARPLTHSCNTSCIMLQRLCVAVCVCCSVCVLQRVCVGAFVCRRVSQCSC